MKISARKFWQQGKYICGECYCDGLRVVDRYEGEFGNAFLMKKMVKRMKNTCKLIKVTGKYDPIDTSKPAIIKLVKETPLPEWQ